MPSASGRVYKIGDLKTCPECGQACGMELFIFKGSAVVAEKCLPCRRKPMHILEPGAVIMPKVCPECGRRKGAGHFLAWPAGLKEARAEGRVWDGTPEFVLWCASCYRRLRDPLANAARLERRRARDAAWRARRAEKQGRRGKPGRPEVLPLAAVVRALEVAGHGLTFAEVAGALRAAGSAASDQTIRKKLARGCREGVLSRDTADPERGGASGFRYRPAPGVRSDEVAMMEGGPKPAPRAPHAGPVGAMLPDPDRMAGVPFRLRRVVEFLRDWEGPANVPTIKAGVSGLGTLAEVEELIRNAPPGVLEEAGRHGGETGYQVAGWGAAQGGGGKTA